MFEGGIVYVDTSVVAAVCFDEPAGVPLDALLSGLAAAGARIASSAIVRVELHRAALRVAQLAGTDGYDHDLVEEALEPLDLYSVDQRVLDTAITLRPHLKTLDSIHLATAIVLGPQVDSIATTDAAMRRVALANGLASLPVPTA